MALSKDVVIRLLGESSSAERAIKSAADAAEVSVSAYRKAERAQAQQTAAAEKAAQRQAEAMQDIGRGAMVMGAVVAAGLALSVRAAVDWESAWAGVMKTVDGSPAEMNALEESLRNLATTLPVTHEEIAGVAEAAGQLGVARGDIVAFTETAIALGVSTNLSAEDAATGLARLSNIMGTSNSDVDRMGSSLVALGNAGASTEGEILDMSLRIGAAGRQAGLSEGEVMGLANAMSSLGIEAEAGGTAISTVLKDINSAVIDGGDQLEGYAEVAGMSAQQFATAWRQDAAGALVTFVEGLGRVQDSGGNVNTTLSNLGLSGIRVSDTLLRLAGNSEGLNDSLSLGNTAWDENNALVREAEQRYATTASQLAMARNEITDAGITIGQTLLPALASGAQLVADFARGFEALPGWMQDTVVIIGVLAAGIGLVGGAAIIAVPKIMAFRTEMALLSTSGGAATSAVGKFGTFMTGPWGAAIGIATLALGGLVTWLGNSSRASEQAQGYQRDLAAALRESGGAIDDNVRALTAQAAADAAVGDSNMLEVADQLGISLPRLTDALLGNRDAYDEVAAAANDVIDQSLLSENAGDMGWTRRAEAARLFLGSLEELSGGMDGAVAENQRLAEASEATGEATDGQATAADGASGAVEEFGSEMADAAELADLLSEALENLNGPTLDLRDAQRGFQDALDGVQESLTENGRTLDIATEAGRANNDALDQGAQSAMDMANAVYATTGSYDQFRANLEGSRQDLFNQARQFYDTDEAAWAYVDSVLAIPSQAETEVLTPGLDTSQVGMENLGLTVRDVPNEKTVIVNAPTESQRQRLLDLGYTIRTLPDGSIEVYADTSAAQAAINALVNQRRTTYVNVVESYSGRSASTQNDFRQLGGAIGGIVHQYAEGGFEPMQGGIAQVVGPNTWRVIGDRAHDDEAYIPINDDPRSQSILAIAAERMGFGLLPFANGGMYSKGFVGGYTRNEDGSWVPASFFADTTLAIYDGVSAGMELAEDGSWVPETFFTGITEAIRAGAPAAPVAPPDDDSFESNSYYSPNRGKPGAVQAEDGSWVLPSFYARASGGPVWPGQDFLVGEDGPEMVRFGGAGQVLPAAETARLLAATRQPRADLAGALAGGSPQGGGSRSTTDARVYSPTYETHLHNHGRAVTAREAQQAAADQEWLRSGGAWRF